MYTQQYYSCSHMYIAKKNEEETRKRIIMVVAAVFRYYCCRHPDLHLRPADMM